jgi:hypothetical protein
MSGAKTDAVNRSASYAVGWRKVGVRSSHSAPLLLGSVQNERTQSLPRRPIDRGLYAGLCFHHHWLGDYWRPAIALDESARRSHRRKMTGPH